MEEKYFNKIKDSVKKKMSEKRYRHTLGVEEKSIELASKYHVDIDKVRIASILHDVCKELPKDKLIDICKKYFPDEMSPEILENTEILHGFAGAITAQHEYGISDPEIIEAIKYHTIGKAGLSLVGRIVYISDVVEKNRDYPEVYSMRKEVEKDMDNGIIYSIDKIVDFLGQKKVYIHPNTLEMRDWLINRRHDGKR